MDHAAVVFDLDGVLVDSEQVWDRVRRDVTAERGGWWIDQATSDMQGMSTPEWAGYLVERMGVQGPPDEVARAVVALMSQRYRAELPLLPGAVEAVKGLAAHWPLAVASSSPPELIVAVLTAARLRDCFRELVSSEEVPRGKPAPDVYLAAAQRLGVDAVDCVAIEDSTSGLRAAAAAGMTVLAVPNAHYPPSPDALELAAETVPTAAGLTPELIRGLPRRR